MEAETKAESPTRGRRRPVEPDPGNAGEGIGGRFLPPIFWFIRPLEERLVMIAAKDSLEPPRSDELPNSRRVYVAGKLHPTFRVPMRETLLAPAKTNNNR